MEGEAHVMAVTLVRGRRASATRSGSGGLICLLGCCVVLAGLASVAPGIVRASWSRVLQQPSSAAPFDVCPEIPGHVSCAMIKDPTRGSARRGQVAAGAITTGPEQPVSPQLFGGGVEGGYAPAELRSAYGLSSSAGAGQTVAVVAAFDDPNAESDLNEYRKQYGIAACTASGGCFRKVNQKGEDGSYPQHEKKWAQEISLDVDMVSAVCPNCHILLVEANTSEEQDIAAAENEAASIGASEISNSFAESTQLEAPDLAAYDHPGIPITAAGGDGRFGVVWPAASPHVIAVGGTTLDPASGRGWVETAWTSTGAGCSSEPKPAWQSDAGCAGRTSNDVAAVADPNTPVSVYDSFETSSPWLLASGTSVSTPIVAGAMALADAYTRSFDGARALYLEAANGVPGFDDITSGSDGTCSPSYLCAAGVGYDGPSGIGSLRRVPEVPPPIAETTRAGGVGPRSATLEGSVDPHGVPLGSCVFELGRAGAAGTTVPCSSQPGAGTSPVRVAAEVTNLEPGVAYGFRVSVSYAGGASVGSEAPFTTTAESPHVATGSATVVSQTSAVLSANVTPEGANVDQCELEYGPTTAYGSLTYCAAAPGSGDAPVTVSAIATQLSPNTLYHYRAVAGSSAGTARGADMTFSTLPLPPVATTLAASDLGAGAAVLNATVDPNGASLSACEFEFANGTTMLPCSPQPGSGEAAVAVSAQVGGLQAGTQYLYRVLAANAGGITYGAIGVLATPGSVLSSGIPSESLTPAASGGAAAGPVRLSCAPAVRGKPLLVGVGGSFSLRLHCRQGHETRATITLRTVARARSGRRSASAKVLAIASVSIPASGRLTAGLRLTPRARRLLASVGMLRAEATLATSRPRPAVSNVGVLVLRLRPA
jgi:hypothetical protein